MTMTEEIFKTWDWHKAENLEQQRDQAILEIDSLKIKHVEELDKINKLSKKILQDMEIKYNIIIENLKLG